MGKRLLTGFLAMCLLLGGCSADRESSVSSGIEEAVLSSDLDESKEVKEPTDDKTIQQLLQNAEWLTVQLSYALNYSSDTPCVLYSAEKITWMRKGTCIPTHFMKQKTKTVFQTITSLGKKFS